LALLRKAFAADWQGKMTQAGHPLVMRLNIELLESRARLYQKNPNFRRLSEISETQEVPNAALRLERVHYSTDLWDIFLERGLTPAMARFLRCGGKELSVTAQ
jgi:hypothetical protein